MSLLVFAQTPPPVHGQSLMVQLLLDGLRDASGYRLFHVNPRLSRNTRDIGRWRVGKVLSLLNACGRAWWLRLRHGPAVLYYVPAPGKRGALWRDFLVMATCRPIFSGLILHWHAAGLGDWLEQHGTAIERWVAQHLLGRASLSIVLGEALRADAAVLQPRHIAVIRNGIADPCPEGPLRECEAGQTLEAVFLGLCAAEKGLFDAVTAVKQANARARTHGSPLVRLRVAGDFPDDGTRCEFTRAAAQAAGMVTHVGFVDGVEKKALLRTANVLVFPTQYPHETQGLVIAEALAFDVPVITTRWRAVHEQLPGRHVYLVEPGRPDQIADALGKLRAAGSPDGMLRQHFLDHFTREKHLAALAQVLRSVLSS